MTQISLDNLQQAKNLIVARWGEMSGYWGINRTMAEIHALLFVTRRPLCTDDIMDQLKISRGNTSMNVRALIDWGLIRRIHVPADRKEYFQADTDVWQMFETIMRERRRREVEPIISALQRCTEMVPQIDAKQDATTEESQDVAEFRRRVEELQTFLATMGNLFDFLLNVGPAQIEQLTAETPPS